jgi:hypothetical protein
LIYETQQLPSDLIDVRKVLTQNAMTPVERDLYDRKLAR